MKIIAKLLKSKRLLVAIGVIALIFLVLKLGALFNLSKDTRLIIVVVILFLWIVFLILEREQANRGARQLELSIKAQADEQIMGLRPAKREEVEQLRQHLIKSIESLKKSKLGKGRSGRSALYALPWYVFIGPPAAGKTTAILNSGLEFPFGAERVRGVGGTRNCDWFFSNSAILMDTAGRYMTEAEDREEWLAFLDILRKYRRRQPINGVIIGVSLADIANANVEELENHARNIRRRLDELIERLGIRFPVYLVFTKCDLLQGFVEFFEDLNRGEREQIWGSTFTQEQQKDSDPRRIFESEFQLLLDSLENFRFNRLSTPTKRETRRKIFVFPLELASLQENLSYFIGQVFQINPYRENPNFRGFYFTSGTQEGVPIDRVIQALAQQFDLTPEIIGPFSPEIEKKSYFIKNLFTEVIIPDQNLIFATSRKGDKKRFLRAGMVAASVIALGLFVLGISQGFVRSKLDMNKVLNASNEVQKINWRGDAMANFRNLDNLQSRIIEVENQKAKILQWGLYRGNTFLQPAKILYLKKASEFINPYLYSEIERRLLDFSNNSNTFRTGAIENSFRAYLLMGSERGRLKNEQKFLVNELNLVLKDNFFQFIDETNVQSARPLIEKQVAFFVDLLAQTDTSLTFFHNKPDLINRVGARIYQTPTIANLYLSIKQNAENTLPPFSLMEILDHRNQEIFQANVEVSGFFTKNGWEKYAKKAIQDASTNPEQDNWIFRSVKKKPARIDKPPEEIANELQDLYFKEYSNAWQTFINELKYASFENLQVAAERLKILSDLTNSPLVVIFKNINEQTSFQNELRSMLPGFIERHMGVHPVDKNFAALHALVESEKDFATILDQYKSLWQKLESMLSDPGANAAECAANIVKGSGDLPTAMQAIGPATAFLARTGTRNVFEQPIVEAWSAILGQTQQFLNEQWLDEVYEPFQRTLAARYPIAASDRDASIGDFETFFVPQSGDLAKFFKKLGPYIKSSWQPYSWEGRGIQISPAVVQLYRKADDLARVLFQGNQLELKFKMILTSTKKDSRIGLKQIYLNIDGNKNFFEVEKQETIGYSWPGNAGPGQASLGIIKERILGRVLGRPEDEILKFDGDWGWIKLLQIANKTKESPLLYKIAWQFNQKEDTWQFTTRSQADLIIKFNLQASSAYNPFENPREFFNFTCPKTIN